MSGPRGVRISAGVSVCVRLYVGEDVTKTVYDGVFQSAAVACDVRREAWDMSGEGYRVYRGRCTSNEPEYPNANMHISRISSHQTISLISALLAVLSALVCPASATKHSRTPRICRVPAHPGLQHSIQMGTFDRLLWVNHLTSKQVALSARKTGQARRRSDLRVRAPAVLIVRSGMV